MKAHWFVLNSDHVTVSLPSLPSESLPMWVDIPHHNNTVQPLCIPQRDIYLTSRNNDPANLLMQPRDIHITWYHTHYIKHIKPRDKLSANLLHAATRHTHLTPRDTVLHSVSTYGCSYEIYTLSKTYYQYIIYTSIMSRNKLSDNLLHSHEPYTLCLETRFKLRDANLHMSLC